MARNLPSQDYLRQCFEYDSETGILIWRRRPREHFASNQSWKAANTKYAGRAFGCQSYGYLVGGLCGKTWMAHRVIWKMIHGNEAIEVDHINGIGTDNRLCNLRNATSSQNKHNTRSRTFTGRVSRFKGVSRNWRGWSARICRDGKTFCLGTYSTEDAAAAAYIAAATKFHGEYAKF